MEGWQFVYYTNSTTIELSNKGAYSEPIFSFEQGGFTYKTIFYVAAKELYLLFTAYVNGLPLPSTIRLFIDTDLLDSELFAVHAENILLTLNGGDARNITSFRIWDNAANKAILIYKEMYGGT